MFLIIILCSLNLFQTKQKTNTDDVNVAPAYVPESPKTTSTSTLPPPPSNAIDDHSSSNGVYISPNSHPERTSSFFAQPGILAGNITLSKKNIYIYISYV